MGVIWQCMRGEDLATLYSYLKVVDRLERVYAPNLAVLEPEEHRFEVFPCITRVLADEKEVWLEQTEWFYQYYAWALFQLLTSYTTNYQPLYKF